MTKIKNIRAGIVIIADAGLKLAPGEMIEMETSTKQVDSAIADGLLARIDAEAEAQPKVRSTGRALGGKSEAKKQSAKAADTGSDDSDGDHADESSGTATGEPAGDASGEHTVTNSGQPEIPGVSRQ